jgi:DNA-3-methyladenine glycosylase II
MLVDYIQHLSKDKKIATILGEPFQLKTRDNISLRLMASIMSQQLNTKVAKVLYHRFLDIYNAEEPTPQEVLATAPETLRKIGLSNAKVSYVHNVARFCMENYITDEKLLAMNNDEIIDLLTEIKGVGRWTVEMLLMFTLGREDVFAADDLGIQQAMMKLYKIKLEDKKAIREKMLKLSAKWRPYRTYACMHLWQWKDNTPDVKEK